MILYKGEEVKNVTLNMLYEIFRDLGTSNLFIQTTSIGDIFEIELNEVAYPLMHVSTNTATYTLSELTYNFQLIFMDLVKKDESNEEEVLSDMLQVAGDILSALKNSDFSNDFEHFRYDIRINEEINCEPFTERFDSQVSGWTADISITVSFDASACAGDIPN